MASKQMSRHESNRSRHIWGPSVLALVKDVDIAVEKTEPRTASIAIQRGKLYYVDNRHAHGASQRMTWKSIDSLFSFVIILDSHITTYSLLLHAGIGSTVHLY